MSTNTPQNPSGAVKARRSGSILSIVIWIALLIIICTVLWVCFTESGQQTLGNIGNKGLMTWLLGPGDSKAEQEAAAAFEKIGVGVVKEGDIGNKRVTSLHFGLCPNPTDEALKQVGNLYNVQIINLSNAKITDDQLAYFDKLNNLTCIALSGTPITDAGLVHLVDLPALQALYLRDVNITDKGLEQILKLSNLTNLDLSHTGITDQGMKKIAQLKNMIWLLINDNNITDAGVSELLPKKQEEKSELKRLTLSSDMKVSKETISKLQKAMPDLQVDLVKPGSKIENPADAAMPAAADAEKENPAEPAQPDKNAN